uniref:Uncharacterized protein n=1 Tax=Romanomermis culicivorax TaxID=13658 RepID=A0A915J9Z9_ROMCU
MSSSKVKKKEKSNNSSGLKSCGLTVKIAEINRPFLAAPFLNIVLDDDTGAGCCIANRRRTASISWPKQTSAMVLPLVANLKPENHFTY